MAAFTRLYPDGSTKEVEGDPFLSDETMKARQRELEVFSACVFQNEDFLRRKVKITMECEPEAFDALGFALCRFLLTTKMKVNGKKHNWSNGCFGSRWCDTTLAGREVRLAFYNEEGLYHIHIMGFYHY